MPIKCVACADSRFLSLFFRSFTHLLPVQLICMERVLAYMSVLQLMVSFIHQKQRWDLNERMFWFWFNFSVKRMANIEHNFYVSISIQNEAEKITSVHSPHIRRPYADFVAWETERVREWTREQNFRSARKKSRLVEANESHLKNPFGRIFRQKVFWNFCFIRKNKFWWKNRFFH